jgi:hypothetical protein
MRRHIALRRAAAVALAATLSVADVAQAAAAACTCNAPYSPHRVRSCCFNNGQWRMVWMCTRPRDPHHPRLIPRPLPCNGRRY